MANQFYPKAKKKILQGSINFDSDTIAAVLVKNTYSYSAEHEFLSEISAHVLGKVALENVAIDVAGSGVVTVGAENLRFEGHSAGNTARALVLLKDTGVPGTSTLIAFYDQAVGLPVVLTEAPQSFEWNATDKVFSW